MSGRLAGRAAIVTGASRGLGRATALALAAEGAAVAVVARTRQQWDERLPGTIGETVAAIEEAGGRAVAIQADLLEREDVPRLVTEARDALGPITVPSGFRNPVHNAGLGGSTWSRHIYGDAFDLKADIVERHENVGKARLCIEMLLEPRKGEFHAPTPPESVGTSSALNP